jgi:glycosyltransferase involved in cell wall biosynthesis
MTPSDGVFPTVSVVIPAYNAAAFVSRAIDSALAQTVPPLEIIVVDDGSTDDTASVVAKYPSPVRLVRQENGGPAAARNHGVRDSAGEWIGWLDADDTWLPRKIERQLPCGADLDVGIIHCHQANRSNVSDSEIPVSFDTLWQRNLIDNSSALVRRIAFDRVGGLDEDRRLIGVEDYNLWLRLTKMGWKVATCPEGLWNYDPEAGSLTSQSLRFARAELANVDKIAELLNLSSEVKMTKRSQICEQYGAELLYHRDFSAARPLLAEAMRCSPTPRRLVLYLATFVPRAILDVRRRQRAHPVSS